MTKHVSPTLQGNGFNCPSCQLFAVQTKLKIGYPRPPMGWLPIEGMVATECANCGSLLFWSEGKLAFPDVSVAPVPAEDMPKSVRPDYLEAASLLTRSPRSSAALLRLALQKLCKELKKPGVNINDDIKSLVVDGLPVKIQQALDIVRVIGNEAVHPGTIDVNDDADTAFALFGLINTIVHDRITQPKEIEALYKKLPQDKREAIDRRDKKKP